MTAGASSWAITGAAGLLRAGSRLAARFEGWDAVRQADGRWRITTLRHTPDPYWLENGTQFRAVLEGRGSEIRGPATIVSTDPLVFDMEIR